MGTSGFLGGITNSGKLTSAEQFLNRHAQRTGEAEG